MALLAGEAQARLQVRTTKGLWEAQAAPIPPKSEPLGRAAPSVAFQMHPPSPLTYDAKARPSLGRHKGDTRQVRVLKDRRLTLAMPGSH